jgi:hypothetical protein
MARICYALANAPTGNPAEPNHPESQKPQNRVLARTEHVLVTPPTNVDPGDPLGMAKFSDANWRDWMSNKEVDAVSLHGWELMAPAQKADILSVIGDVEVSVPAQAMTPGTGGTGGAAGGWGTGSAVDLKSSKNAVAGGVTLGPANPQSLHAFLCRGIGHFEIQGWSDAEQRWIPQVNPNGDTNLKDDSDFLLQGDELDPRAIPGLWYPRGPVVLRDRTIGALTGDFRQVPGLGRALKFTFTLYDSRGLIPGGRTFTHIVYLDN